MCTTIGVDLSKSVFQLSLADSKHRIVCPVAAEPGPIFALPGDQ